MKSIVTTIVLAVLFLNSAFSNESSHWNYLEVSRIILQSDTSGENPEGFGIDSKYTLNEMVYLTAAYQQYGTSSNDIDRILVGFGAKYTVNENVTPFAQFTYVDIESSTSSLSVGINYWIIGLGVAGEFEKISYKAGLNRYVESSLNAADDTGFFIEAYYSINNEFSAGLEVESIDNKELYNIAIRYHF